MSRGCRRYVRECRRARRYRPVEGVDWDAMRDMAEGAGVLLGREVDGVAGSRGGRRDEEAEVGAEAEADTGVDDRGVGVMGSRGVEE